MIVIYFITIFICATIQLLYMPYDNHNIVDNDASMKHTLVTIL